MPILRNKHEIALDEVAEICREAADHYRTAWSVVDDPPLAEIFGGLEENRRRWAAALAEEIRRMGNLPGAPDADREAFEHLATRLKAALSSDERQALLSRCLHLEEKLAASLDAALDRDLPPSTLDLLRRLGAEGEAVRELLVAAQTSVHR